MDTLPELPGNINGRVRMFLVILQRPGTIPILSEVLNIT